MSIAMDLAAIITVITALLAAVIELLALAFVGFVLLVVFVLIAAIQARGGGERGGLAIAREGGEGGVSEVSLGAARGPALERSGE